MKKFYCAVHKDEYQPALEGERLDAMTEHMVKARSYYIDTLDVVVQRGYVVWVMRNEGDFFVFDSIVRTIKDL